MPDIGGSFLAVPASLEGAGAFINGVAGQMQTELDALKNQILATTALWTGETKNLYDPLQHQWDMAAAQLFGPGGLLGQIAQVMNLNWDNYVEGETTNARSMMR